LCIDSFGPTEAAQAGSRQLTITGTSASDVSPVVVMDFDLGREALIKNKSKAGQLGVLSAATAS
jgi:hypothetical protein